MPYTLNQFRGEVFIPFLSPRIVGFVNSLPPDYLFRGNLIQQITDRATTKWFHRAAMRSMLPDSIVDQKKIAFSNPLATWLKESGVYVDYKERILQNPL